MIIKTKYSPGDICWIIGRELDIELECRQCKGLGKMFNRLNEEFKCNECWGKGKTDCDRLVPVKVKITVIRLKVDSNEQSVSYTTNKSLSTFEEQIYETKEKAQEYINSWNAKHKYVDDANYVCDIN